MSLADPFFPTLWAELAPLDKRDAVAGQLLAGRSAEEAAEILSGLYGPIGTNHVRGVIDRHRLADDPAIRGAQRARKDMEQRAARARSCAGRGEGRGAGQVVTLRPGQSTSGATQPGGRLPQVSLPQVPLPNPGGSTKPGPAGVSLFDLNTRTCRRPLWQDPQTAFAAKLFCGRPTKAAKSFCAGCAREIYRAPGEDR